MLKFYYHLLLHSCILVSAINFNQSTYRVYKSDGVVQPVLYLSSALPNDITVKIISSKANDPGPHHVRVQAGISNVSFKIQMCNDKILEGNLNFIIYIDLPSLPSGVTVGPCSQATIIVLGKFV